MHPLNVWTLSVTAILIVAIVGICTWPSTVLYTSDHAGKSSVTILKAPELDKRVYDQKMLALAQVSTTTIAALTYATTTGNTTLSSYTPESLASSTIGRWPTRVAYPKHGAILPDRRIIAYYGNFYSKGMGVLGQYDEAEVLRKLREEVAAWNNADPSTPVLPAIDYIATTAQESPGKEGLYTLRMPDSQIDHALELAAKVDGIVILELQIGLSNLKRELPLLENYLKMPQVHLALDPEFAMHGNSAPGTVVGSFDAAEINYASHYLAGLVDTYRLPPKVLIVHRFTEDMVTNYKKITPLPQVQIVMDMDGWGDPAKKKNTYNRVIAPQPVQFTGFKLFYKNDLKPPSTRLLTPAEVLELTPAPSFIQYQ